MSKLVLVVLVAFLVAVSGAAAARNAVPHRIVSLSPTATEDLFAIGAGPQVIAVDDQSDYPKQAPRTKLSGFTPNAEAIVGYHPDLVVISYDPNGLTKALGKAHIKVVLQPSAHTLAGAYGQIAQLGGLTGHVAAAKALVARMQRQIATAVRSVPKPPRQLSVYQEFSPDFYSASSHSYVGQIYTLFGLKNIADPADTGGSGFPQLSAEYIVAANPDLIVLSDISCCGQTRATVAARPGWNQITAVKRGTIALIADSIASRWGPRTVNFVRAVASALRTYLGK